MAVYRTTVTLDATAAYPAVGSPQVTIPFLPKRVMLINEHPSVGALMSYDATTDHAQLTPGTPSAGIVFRQSATQLYFKRAAAATGLVVQIIAEN